MYFMNINRSGTLHMDIVLCVEGYDSKIWFVASAEE